MADLRVAMLIQAYAPHVGGAERQLQSLLPRLRDRGIEGRVFTRSLPGTVARETIDGTLVERMAAPSWAGKTGRSLMFVAGSLASLRRWRPHLVHAHELLSPTTAALLGKATMGTPVVAKVLRGGELGDVAKLESSFHGRLRLRAIARMVDAFAVISEEIDLELERAGVPSARRHAIPNGVDVERFRPLSPQSRVEARAARGISDDRPIALYAGRLVPEKGLHHLLAAWKVVSDRHPHARLWVAGDGPDRGRLQDRAIESVEFLGWVEEIESILPLADVFVLPSDTEGLSNAMLEAMAAEVPVIASAVGAAEDLLSSGGCRGLLVPPRDPRSLADALDELLSRPSKRRAMAQRARAFVTEGYSLDVTANRLARLYRSLAEGDSQ